MDRISQFQNLIEITSLDKKIQGHLGTIEDARKRIDFLHNQKQTKLDQHSQVLESLDTLNEENAAIEKELFQKSSSLEKAKEHLSMATSQKQLESLEKEIAMFSKAIEPLEDQGLEILEKIENLEAERDELDGFLTGIDTTIPEIEAEVSEIETNENKEISNYEERIENLLSCCEKFFKETYMKSNENFRFNAPLTFIMGRHCKECRYEIDETARDAVDRNHSLEFCPGCNRIICPISATTT